MKKIIVYWIYLLIVWGVFRLTIRLSLLEEEMIIKPLVWGWPIVGWHMLGREKMKLFGGSIFKAMMEGLVLGGMFVGVIVSANLVKVGGVIAGTRLMTGLSAMEIVTMGLATAIVEEVVFAGFILGKLGKLMKNDLGSLILTTIMYASLHIPIGLFVYGYLGWNLTGFLAIVALAAVARFWVMQRVGNLWAPIIAHWVWGLTVWAIG